MIKKIKNIVYVVSFFVFTGLAVNYYFSDQNVKKTNMSRTFYLSNQNNNLTEFKFNINLIEDSLANIYYKLSID